MPLVPLETREPWACKVTWESVALLGHLVIVVQLVTLE